MPISPLDNMARAMNAQQAHIQPRVCARLASGRCANKNANRLADMVAAVPMSSVLMWLIAFQ